MGAMDKKTVVWVTGPAASGKNEVCGILKKRSFLIIDADKIGHEVLEKKKNSVKRAFGAWVIKNGKVDRKDLRRIVFGSRSALKKLNAIVHPELIKSIKHKVRAAGRRNIAINAALYKELSAGCPDAYVISVLASRGARVKRLLLSRKTGLKDVLSLISLQQKDSYYKKVADVVILNDSSMKDLQKQVLKAIGPQI